jgi:hypothetical protein
MQDHPILSKLGTIDRMALGAELAAEGSSVFACGFIRGLKHAVELVENIHNNVGNLSDDTKRAFTALVITLAGSAENYVAEIKKGEASSLYDEN